MSPSTLEPTAEKSIMGIRVEWCGITVLLVAKSKPQERAWSAKVIAGPVSYFCLTVA